MKHLESKGSIVTGSSKGIGRTFRSDCCRRAQRGGQSLQYHPKRRKRCKGD